LSPLEALDGRLLKVDRRRFLVDSGSLGRNILDGRL
jgi:hypothetical protein